MLHSTVAELGTSDTTLSNGYLFRLGASHRRWQGIKLAPLDSREFGATLRAERRSRSGTEFAIAKTTASTSGSILVIKYRSEKRAHAVRGRRWRPRGMSCLQWIVVRF
jgi:hypothetical protein